MKTYIALLRGINVSGHKLIKMSDLKLLFENCGFENVTTYIQSGNVVFSSSILKKEEIKKCIEITIENTFNFDVTTLILDAEELIQAKENHPFLKNNPLETKAIYFIFLDDCPNSELINNLNTLNQETEFFKITDKVIYCFYPNGYGDSKWHNVFFEKKLKVSCTTRNYNTMLKLCELSERIG